MLHINILTQQININQQYYSPLNMLQYKIRIYNSYYKFFEIIVLNQN